MNHRVTRFRALQSRLAILVFTLALGACDSNSQTIIAPALTADDDAVEVLMKTSMGDISIALDAARAPATVSNFLQYVESGHYDGTIFHRVITDFMIQGGGFTASFDQKSTLPPIASEADNGLSNIIYSIAMARTNDPHSATAQFYINVANNSNLDYVSPSPAGWGYTVFGAVVDGMDVVDQIAIVSTGASDRFSTDVPIETVTINTVTRANP